MFCVAHLIHCCRRELCKMRKLYWCALFDSRSRSTHCRYSICLCCSTLVDHDGDGDGDGGGEDKRLKTKTFERKEKLMKFIYFVECSFISLIPSILISAGNKRILFLRNMIVLRFDVLGTFADASEPGELPHPTWKKASTKCLFSAKHAEGDHEMIRFFTVFVFQMHWNEKHY